MKFSHIHISSRFSRSPANLENALDVFRTKSSVITMTEVGRDDRKRTIAEKGWGWFSGSGGEAGVDECSTSWELATWTQVYARAVKLIGRWPTYTGGTRWAVYANTVVLKHKTSGHRVLFSTIHTPNKIGGASGFKPQGANGAERIASYKRMIKNWDDHIAQVARNQKADCIVISADFNIKFRNGWVRTYLVNSFKDLKMKQSWKHFTGGGTFGRAIIDGSLYVGLSTDQGSFVIPDPGNSSDHNPFKTNYETTVKAGTPVKPAPAGPKPPADPTPDPPPTGSEGYGVAWWNFDDYADDTVYEVEQT